MEVLTLILGNLDNIVAAVLIIMIVVALIKKGETEILKEILFSLITKAEEDFGAGTGKIKYSNVVDWLYERIPAVLKPLFSAKDLETLIETGLEEAKIKWAKNPNLLQTESVDTDRIKSVIDEAVADTNEKVNN